MGEDFCFAIDAAASEMFNAAMEAKGKYGYYFWKTKKFYTCNRMIKYWEKLVEKYPIISIEDPLSENDWNGWVKLTKKLGKKITKKDSCRQNQTLLNSHTRFPFCKRDSTLKTKMYIIRYME